METKSSDGQRRRSVRHWLEIGQAQDQRKQHHYQRGADAAQHPER